jgi:7-cyano-7-deazaguanine synthase
MSAATAGALVLFSGGQDSTTCLALALDRYERVETVGFDYGQRHRVELDQRAVIRESLRQNFPAWRERLGDDHLIRIETLAQISTTAMTHDVAIVADGRGLPNTFVPGRNLVFLTLAAAIAYRRGFKHIIGGMCETDFSGYPDCRDDTVKAMQLALNLGMDARFVVETPLMWLDKAATWRLAQTLGGAALVDLILEATHSCYLGERAIRHEWGYGCGTCPACRLRAEGWRKYMASLENPVPASRNDTVGLP